VPKPKLLLKPGKKVPEWSLTAKQLERIRPRPEELEKFRPELKLRPLPVPKRQALLFPELMRPSYLLRPYPFLCRILCPPRLRVRKNQKSLTPLEWARFIGAIEALAESGIPSPTYAEFVDVHNQSMTTHMGHTWGAHTMGGHDGRNFLTWHREYLAKLEARLATVNPLVTIPYWDWVNDRAIPPELSDPADLAAWGITRGATFNGAALPSGAWINSVLATGVTPPDFTAFSGALESPHNTVHVLVGGTMQTATSPADPLFWLHHAFIDKLWADWQLANVGAMFNPPNTAETLQPPPILTRTVNQVLSTQALGYVYA
jgi:tyrosinase